MGSLFHCHRMRKVLQSTLLLFALATPAFAQTSMDFYLTLLRRGTADVEAGRHADATTNLRLAAFGLLDSVEHYQTAQAYLAVAFDRLGQTQQAREAAQRVVAAEKVEKKFRGIALPAAIRTAFDAVAKKVLTASDAALLSGGATAPATTATIAPPAVVNRVDVQTETRKPAAQPATKPVPVQTETPKTQPPAPKPEPTVPKPQPAQPQNTQPARPQTSQSTRPQTPQPQPAQRSVDIAGQFAAGERALSSANITEARRLYRELLGVTTLDHGMLVRLAEGFYRARDFANTLVAFDRAGTLRPGEEPYHYYIAVAAFEAGQYDRARRELAAALPFIEQTPDVQRYRVRIEGTR
jgi:tetratricopeptide (TPR) repeat protein